MYSEISLVTKCPFNSMKCIKKTFCKTFYIIHKILFLILIHIIRIIAFKTEFC